MTLETWIHFHGEQALRHKDVVLKLLERAGVILSEPDAPSTSAPGILLFSNITQDLCALVRERSQHGMRRVLSIAVDPRLLNDGNAWLVLDAGASDLLIWNESPELAIQIARRLERWRSVDQSLASPLVQKNLVGTSPVWKSLLRSVIEVARFTDSSIVILGESGTGKELLARLIHTLDMRADKRELVIQDCTNIVPELSGSEFFGHERGSFTGATGLREGCFALADGGTLFLDEIGELPLGLQAQLLRVLQERTYKRIGGNQWQRTAFRLVCATNRDLPQIVSSGRFRGDLYYRIASCVLRVPPLRERVEDILPLTHHFLNELLPKQNTIRLDECVKQYLLKRQYPGNVRELKQLVTRISQRHVGDAPISIGDIPEDLRPSDKSQVSEWRDERFDQAIRRALTFGAGLKDISAYASETAIRIAVGAEHGNLQRAARKLGVTDRALQMRQANRKGPV